MLESSPSQPPSSPRELSVRPERLKNQHYDYVVVFGQGPVQEKNKIPQTGREGLNFYSRLEAKAAAEMLRQKITTKLILTGGQTGTRAGTNEAQTEADLMLDIVKRELGVDEEGNFYDNSGHPVKFDSVVYIDNKAKDTWDNFTNIMNEYLDKNGLKNKVALLGMEFHAHASNKLGIGGADIGRLEALSKILAFDAPVYSTEEVLEELIINKKKYDETSAIAQMMTRLTEKSRYSNVTLLKIQQEGVLVDMIKKGDWLRIIEKINNLDRIKLIFSNNPEGLKLLGVNAEEFNKMSIEDIKTKAKAAHEKVTADFTIYEPTKKMVFKALKRMGKITREKLSPRNMLESYGKAPPKK